MLFVRLVVPHQALEDLGIQPWRHGRVVFLPLPKESTSCEDIARATQSGADSSLLCHFEHVLGHHEGVTHVAGVVTNPVLQVSF